jgi:lipoprotein NlpD
MGVPGIDRYRFAVLAVCLTLVLGGCASAVRWENTADGVQGQTYTVRRGDTLYSIAFRHQLDYRSLARWNGIGGSYLIKPGQTLRLYPSGSTQQPDTTVARSPSPTTRTPPPARSPTRSTPTPPSRPASPPAKPAIAKGQWLWPVRGDILRAYSERSKGIDIGGQVGESIRASAGGTVVYAGSALKGYGQLVIIKHSEAELSAYGHNRKLLVKEGQRVEQGDVLAEMGLGPSRQPLLHFEIRHNGQPVNPLGLLPRA